jgi:hypothetical protein
MRAKETARLVGGSIAVYVIMAACSAASGPNGFTPSGQAQGHGSSGGTSSGGTSSGSTPEDGSGGAIDDGSGTGSAHDGMASGSSGILDAFTDPVPTASADSTQSGTRLKASYYVGSDGSKTFSTMHDNQLNVDCSFATASDGTIRCLPTGGASVGSYYADSGCSQALAYAYVPCGSTPSYATQYLGSSGRCNGYMSHLFPVSGAFSGTVYSGAPSSCVATTTPYSVYSIGSELAPSTFVQATVQTDM